MPKRIIRASYSGGNTDRAPGSEATFGTITSDTGAVANATVNSASLYISALKSYSDTYYLDVHFGTSSTTRVARTAVFDENSSIHAETIALQSLAASLLTGRPSRITLVVITTGGTGNKINIRSGATLTLTINYTLNNTPPGPPTRAGSGGKTYNPQPRVLAQLGADADGDTLSVSASGFAASRSSAPQQGKVVLRRLEPLTEAGAFAAQAANADPYGESASADLGGVYAVPAWTDDPAVAGETPIRAAHIMELRAALDDVCDYYGLPRTDWGSPVLAGETSSLLWPAHALQLQQTVRRVADAVNAWDPEGSALDVVLPAMLSVRTASAAALNQLRQMITLL